jgi:hypothetical protein
MQNSSMTRPHETVARFHIRGGQRFMQLDPSGCETNSAFVLLFLVEKHIAGLESA